MEYNQVFDALTDGEFAVLYWKCQGLSLEQIETEFENYSLSWIQKRSTSADRKLGLGNLLPKDRKVIIENEVCPALQKWIENHPDKVRRLPPPPIEEPEEPPPLSPIVPVPPIPPITVITRPRPNFSRVWILLIVVAGIISVVGYVAFRLGSQRPIPVQSPQTNTSQPSSTLLPSSTPNLQPTLTNTPLPTETPAPTFTLVFTEVPTQTRLPFGLKKGETLSDNRVSLYLKDVRFNELYDRVGSRVAPISYYFDFTNHSGDQLLLQFGGDNFVTTNIVGGNAGAKNNCSFVVVVVADATVNIPVNNGETKQIIARCGLGRVTPDIQGIILTITKFSSLPDSTWFIEIPH